MSKLVFKPEMFEVEYIATSISSIKRDTDKYESAKSAQKAFDEWLEKQTVVFGFGASDGWGWRTDSRNGETKKAYVVCIEEIKKCEHKEVASYANYLGNTFSFGFECKDCNKQLKPKNGWEIAE